MPPEVPTFLWDAVENANEVLELTDHIEEIELDQDRNLRHLIERKLEIIGEVLNRLRRDFPELFIQISDGPGYINLRNIIAHNYANVDSTIVFRTCKEEIPLLRSEILSILGESETDTVGS